MENFKEYLVNEELKIVKKNWKLSDTTNQDFVVEINDSPSHSIIDRIKDRTDMKLVNMNKKLQKGVDYILKKNQKGFFKYRVSYVELTYKKSNFKVIFMIKPEQKYLRISSIFEMSYNTEGAYYWNINEFIKDNPEFEKDTHHGLELNESKLAFYTIDNKKNDKFFSVEMNEKTNSYDVYLSFPSDVILMDTSL